MGSNFAEFRIMCEISQCKIDLEYLNFNAYHQDIFISMNKFFMGVGLKSNSDLTLTNDQLCISPYKCISPSLISKEFLKISTNKKIHLSCIHFLNKKIAFKNLNILKFNSYTLPDFSSLSTLLRFFFPQHSFQHLLPSLLPQVLPPLAHPQLQSLLLASN
ncbi:hypothetical protein BpHYR1_027848 [Brachionus plicatilis]|uniref:Uncharacterized protein n=1 Tax=Brachionus plicatilis TaxID=10195 RepID=A0A3M7RPR2_BRAPC|nr:hypothetical protein BpHYR1_027848 [Brachionus plicatilis]